MRFAANLSVCVLAALLIVWLCRWIRRRDTLIGTIVQIGLALRLWSGLLLFGISYLKLPILQGLYIGDGFWDLAPDARGYYWAARIAAEDGLRTVRDSSPSPVFVKALGLWMHAVGISPASAVLLNAVGYLGIAGILVAALGRDRSRSARWAVALSLFAFTFSPAFLLFGTQALKDQFLSLLLAGTCGAVWVGFTALLASTGRRGLCAGALGAIAAALLTYLVAGIRPYVAFLFVLTVTGVLAAFTLRRSLRQVPAYLLACALVVALLWVSFRAGAGPYYGYYETSLLAVAGLSTGQADPPAGEILAAREGFVNAGGATNVVPRVRRYEGAGLLRRAWERIEQLVLGTLVLLVPISLLRWLSIVQFEGGRGLLLVTDIDTLFIDVTLIAVVLLLKRAWKPPRPNLEYAVFTVILCVVLAALMGFVVTNFGSLFRLRLMVAALIWLLPLAIVRSGIADPQPSEPGAGAPIGTGRQ